MRLAKMMLPLTMALVSASCARVGVMRVKSEPPKPSHCKLDVYTSEKEVTVPFEVLCLIDAQTSPNAFASKTVAAAVEKAKPEACKCGADAIIFVGGDTEGPNFWSGGRGRAMIKAIRYKGSPPR